MSWVDWPAGANVRFEGLTRERRDESLGAPASCPRARGDPGPCAASPGEACAAGAAAHGPRGREGPLERPPPCPEASFSRSSSSSLPRLIWAMGRVMPQASLSGQSAVREDELGSSRFTERRSASLPSRSTSSGEVPGMTLA